MSTNETLRKIGLNDKEIKVYLALLKAGRVTPTLLSQITKINRATIYNISKSLLTKGIIAEDLGGKTLYLVPLPVESLNQIVEKPRRELKEKEVFIKKAIEELTLITAEKKYPVPKIRFVEESGLENFLFENYEKWAKEVISSDGIWWGFQDPGFVENYEEWIDWTWKQKISKNPNYHINLLSNDSKIEQKMKRKSLDRRNIRFVSDTNFSSTTWVAGDYLVMVVTGQHPFYLFEIHDKTLAHNMREIFKKLWFLSESKL